MKKSEHPWLRGFRATSAPIQTRARIHEKWAEHILICMCFGIHENVSSSKTFIAMNCMKLCKAHKWWHECGGFLIEVSQIMETFFFLFFIQNHIKFKSLLNRNGRAVVCFVFFFFSFLFFPPILGLTGGISKAEHILVMPPQHYKFSQRFRYHLIHLAVCTFTPPYWWSLGGVLSSFHGIVYFSKQC